MTARGVNTPGVNMVTSHVTGAFRKDHRTREEVLKLMGY
jgi:GTP cyclohydrolase I